LFNLKELRLAGCDLKRQLEISLTDFDGQLAHRPTVTPDIWMSRVEK